MPASRWSWVRPPMREQRPTRWRPWAMATHPPSTGPPSGSLSASGEVLDAVVRRPTLNDVFMNLTGHAAEERAEDEEADE